MKYLEGFKDIVNKADLSSTLIDPENASCTIEDDLKALSLVDNEQNVGRLDELVVLHDECNYDDVVFDEVKPRAARGRPAGSKTKRLVGTPCVPQFQDYTVMIKSQKVKMILQFLGDRNYVANLLEKGSNVKMDHLKHINETNLSDFFMEKYVDIDVLKFNCDPDALDYLKAVIKKKRECGIYTCPLCNDECGIDTVQCNYCHVWYHFNCVNLQDKYIDTDLAWYCDKCLTF